MWRCMCMHMRNTIGWAWRKVGSRSRCRRVNVLEGAIKGPNRERIFCWKCMCACLQLLGKLEHSHIRRTWFWSKIYFREAQKFPTNPIVEGNCIPTPPLSTRLSPYVCLCVQSCRTMEEVIQTTTSPQHQWPNMFSPFFTILDRSWNYKKSSMDRCNSKDCRCSV